MKNDIQKEFLDCLKKIDSTNIIFKNKSRDIYNGKIFFT